MTFLNSLIIIKFVVKSGPRLDFPPTAVKTVKKHYIAKLIERKKAFQQYRRGVQRGINTAYNLNM